MRCFVILTCLVISISCSSPYCMRHNYQNGEKRAEKLFNSLKSKGNVFMLQSTFSTESIIWYYEDNSIHVLRCDSGRVQHEDVCLIDNPFISEENGAIEFEEKAIYVLDGEVLSIYIASYAIDTSLPVDISQLLQEQYTSALTKRIVEDMLSFRLIL